MKAQTNKILIITTEGCEGCYIARKNVDFAIFQSSKEITKEVKDRDEVKDLIKQNRIKDFPAVLYYVDDIIKHKAIGSYSTAVYLRWIDMYF